MLPTCGRRFWATSYGDGGRDAALATCEAV
jgi:hypothetical protein